MTEKKRVYTVSPLFLYYLEEEAKKHGVAINYLIELALYDRYCKGDISKLPKVRYEKTPKSYDL